MTCMETQGISRRGTRCAPQGGLAQSWRAAGGDLTARIFEATSPVFGRNGFGQRDTVGKRKGRHGPNDDGWQRGHGPGSERHAETASLPQEQAGRGERPRGARSGTAGNHGRHGLRYPVPVACAEQHRRALVPGWALRAGNRGLNGQRAIHRAHRQVAPPRARLRGAATNRTVISGGRQPLR